MGQFFKIYKAPQSALWAPKTILLGVNPHPQPKKKKKNYFRSALVIDGDYGYWSIAWVLTLTYVQDPLGTLCGPHDFVTKSDK